MAQKKFDTAQDALTALAKAIGQRYEKDWGETNAVYFLNGLRLSSDSGNIHEEYVLKYKEGKWVIEEE